jgi:hypothetical protein
MLKIHNTITVSRSLSSFDYFVVTDFKGNFIESESYASLLRKGISTKSRNKKVRLHMHEAYPFSKRIVKINIVD